MFGSTHFRGSVLLFCDACFWIWDDDPRAIRTATVQDLLAAYDVVAIEEAHIEPDALKVVWTFFGA